ncbi:hypothetical protein [Campylobacter sp. MG1]|uniref:hypothetical protein n=1 Tax=Campylobacter sp. MG1 TaxID=2976332 RepID=UPI00226C83A9|nr:hypothetical protein [Campylobacter sp. MG1]
MKKILSFIELIIACLILAILFILIYTKLDESKSNVEISKAAQNMATLIKEINEYYINYGKIIEIQLMTKTSLDKYGWFFVKSNQCLHISTEDEFLIIEKTQNPEGLCAKFLNYDAVKSLLIGKDSTKKDANMTNINENNKIYIKIGEHK